MPWSMGKDDKRIKSGLAVKKEGEGEGGAMGKGGGEIYPSLLSFPGYALFREWATEQYN